MKNFCFIHISCNNLISFNFSKKSFTHKAHFLCKYLNGFLWILLCEYELSRALLLYTTKWKEFLPWFYEYRNHPSAILLKHLCSFNIYVKSLEMFFSTFSSRVYSFVYLNELSILKRHVQFPFESTILPFFYQTILKDRDKDFCENIDHTLYLKEWMYKGLFWFPVCMWVISKNYSWLSEWFNSETA
jgi:hypothetical protein